MPQIDRSVSELVRRAWEGEVLGEALFDTLAAREADERRRRALRAAEQLEAQTRGDAEALAAALGVELPAGDDQRAAGAQGAAVLAAMTWPEQMQAVASATGAYRDLYEQLDAALGGDHRAELDRLVAHERVLHRFAETEAAGDDGLGDLLNALDPERRTSGSQVAPTPSARST